MGNRVSAAERGLQKIEPVTLEQVTAKIKQKEQFYLLVGRNDNHDFQVFLEQLEEEYSMQGKTFYHLSTKGLIG
ncbi:hypothetical protein [Streptococcus sp. 20-1249]|uniref:hypothetical protein n=1 Tax=Streptococcus hepaticus TaxID=3349163 RepID=UPI0037479ADF